MIDSPSETSLANWLGARRSEDRDRVVAEHAYLCKRAARRFMRPGIDRADLEQIAAIGLIKAVDRYDRGQRTPFEAYAWLLIVGELMHYVRDGERMLRAPRRIRDLARRWIAAERELWVLMGREPSAGDVGAYLNATPQQHRDVMAYRASNHVASADFADPTERHGIAESTDAILDKVLVDQLLARLAPLEQKIVRSIHLEGATVAELAGRLGYSRRHVTRLHGGAMARLRNLP